MATLTEEQAERMLAEMNEVIRAGEEMRKLRAELITVFAGFGWGQDRIARITDVSQPAVSKQLAKRRTDDPPAPMDLELDQRDTPWLEGRLWGLAEEISERFLESARCTPFVTAIARGKKRFTPRTVDELRRLVEEDLRLHRTQLPGTCRAAYDQISRGLDLATKAGKATKPVGSASVRRALARQLQRDQLQRDQLKGDQLKGDS
ncbi:hypothetical protein GCM10009789_30160 [Kribbella sancticallisti]|uniref:Sigma-70 family RNA polymerase sigma factor n=1 Tax=Kribbella sancticallisti TaxID=460087 RepID=A0ABN2DC99_9ACTN